MRKRSSSNYANQIVISQQCPLAYALTIVGNRWKPYILWKLTGKTLRFSEIKNEIPNISEKMLIKSLTELIEHGLILKKDFEVFPKKVEYSLSPLGEELVQSLVGLCVWGELAKANHQ